MLTVGCLKKQRRKLLFVVIILLLIGSIVSGLVYIKHNPPYEQLLGWFTGLSPFRIGNAKLEIEFDSHSEKLLFRADLDIFPEKEGRNLLVFALGGGLDIKQAWINDQELKVWRLWVANIIFLPSEVRGDEFNLKLVYDGFPAGFFAQHSQEYISENFCYIDANTLYYPVTGLGRCEKDDLETVITLVGPDDLESITAGDLVQEERINNKYYRTWSQVGTGYFTQVVFGDFEKLAVSDEKEIRVYLPFEYREYIEVLAETMVDIAVRYHQQLGMVEPEHLNLVVLPVTSGGRFHHGMITCGCNRMEFNEKGRPNRQLYNLLAHEFGHFYWHGSDDLDGSKGQQWYVEGFTEYASEWITGHKFGMQAYVDNLNRKITYLHNNREAQKSLQDYSYWEYSTIPYYRGTMMLESLRRSEGADAVLEFLNIVRRNPQELKTMNDLVEAAKIAFTHDYTEFFTYWLQTTEPIFLEIIDFNLENTIVSMNVASSHDLPFPLEILVSGVEGREIVSKEIVQGDNRLSFTVNNSIRGVYLDPYRRLYRLEEMFEYPAYRVPLAKMNIKQAQEYSSVSSVDTSFDDIKAMSDKWIDVGQELEIDSQKWRLESILADYDSYWAILKNESNVSYSRLYLTLSDSRDVLYPQEIYSDHEQGLVLLRWLKHEIETTKYTGGQIIRIAASNAETGDSIVEIKLPLCGTIDDAPYYAARQLAFADFQLEVGPMIYRELGTEIQIKIIPKSGYTAQIVDTAVYSLIGQYMPTSSLSGSQDGDQLAYKLFLPLVKPPFPVGIQVNGLTFKEKMKGLPLYIPEGFAWIGVKDQDYQWQQSQPGKLQLASGQEVYLHSALAYKAADRHYQLIVKAQDVDSEAVNHQLVLRVKGEEGLIVKPYLCPLDSHNLENDQYHLPSARIENDKVEIPLNFAGIDNGCYDFGIDLEDDSELISRIRFSNVLLIYDPEAMRELETEMTRILQDLLDPEVEYDAKHSERAYWSQLRNYVLDSDYELELEDIHISTDYEGKIAFHCEVRVSRVGVNTSSFVIYNQAVLDDEGNISFR